MPARETLTASPATFGDVMSNGKRYIVPTFQRDYAWTESEWRELWDDIVAAAAAGDGGNHFLGALVLQPTSERGTYHIIDGQQRLVTLSVLVLAAIARIEQLDVDEAERKNNQERARLLRERFVSTKDSASLQHRSRMTLDQTANGFYQTYVLQGRTPQNPRSLMASERRLYECFEYFSDRIAKHVDVTAGGAGIATFVDEHIAARLSFIEIHVEDDETAFTVFETLNARGVALGTADLLKNYVYACASRGGPSDLENARQLWARIGRHVELERVATLLFHKLSSTVPNLREKRVFVELKSLVPAKTSVFDFLYGLESAAEVYAALDDPEAELWEGEHRDATEWVRVLSTLGLDQYKSVALVAFDKFRDRPKKWHRTLHNIAMISVRAVITKVNTGDLARAYQTTAHRIEKGELKSPYAIARALADVTPSDEEFRKGFETLAIDPRGRRRKFLRYLLSKLEEDLGSHAIDFDVADATIEHILPENPGPAWSAFAPEDRERDTVRLGNLTPLEWTLNREIANAAFETKRAAYQRSRYALTRAITAGDWTPAAVRARQADLAQRAVNRWRVIEGDE